MNLTCTKTAKIGAFHSKCLTLPLVSKVEGSGHPGEKKKKNQAQATGWPASYTAKTSRKDKKKKTCIVFPRQSVLTGFRQTLAFEKVCRSANSEWPLNCSRWTVMTSCLLTQFGHLCPSFLSVRVRVWETHTCHLMTPSDHVTSAAVRFFSFKLAALHKSGRLFQCEATPRKAAQARRVTVALAKCQLTWLVMVTVSPFVTVSSLFPGSAVKSYKTCPFKHSRHKTNNFNIDEWQQGWIIVHERR